MNKQMLYGIGLGVLATVLFMKYRKKPCGCNGGEEEVEANTDDENFKKDSLSDFSETEVAECNKAVTQVMSAMKFASNEARESFRQKELLKCLNTN